MTLDDNDDSQPEAEEISLVVDDLEDSESISIPVESSADLLARISGGDSDGEDLATAPVFRRDLLGALKNRSNRSRTEKGLGFGRRSQSESEPEVPSGGYRVRRVRRLVRHVEPWSVLKVSLVFYLCVWGLLVIATRMLWGAAEDAGTISKIESFIEELFALESFVFDSAQLFRIFVLGGLVLVVGWIGVTVVLVILFNLISDLTGGIRFTMVEEETAVRQRRLRRDDVLVGTTDAGAESLSETASGE